MIYVDKKSKKNLIFCIDKRKNNATFKLPGR
jgi:hypothetical protein